MDRMAAMRNVQPGTDPVERLRQRATAMSDTGAALQKLAEATDPLYKSLDDSQKRRFAVLNRLTGADRGQMRGRDGHGRHGGPWMGPRRMDGGPAGPEHSGEQRL
jgi:zinc resistance-associated protein